MTVWFNDKILETLLGILAAILGPLFGLIWLVSPGAVFLIGTAMAGVSLILARLVPEHPDEGCEAIWQERAKGPASAPAE